MLAGVLAASAMASTVAVAVAMSAQNNALEQRTTASIKSASDAVKVELSERIGTANTRSAEAVSSTDKLAKSVGEQQAEANKRAMESKKREAQMRNDVAALGADVVPGLNQHVQVSEDKLELASSPERIVDVTVGRGALRANGDSVYIDSPQATGYVNVGNSVKIRGVRIAERGSPVHIGGDRTVFNDVDGSTHIMPTRGKTVSISSGTGGDSESYGFSAANSFVKLPGQSALVKHQSGAQIEVGGEGVNLETSNLSPISLKSARVDVSAPDGLCMDGACLRPDDMQALSVLLQKIRDEQAQSIAIIAEQAAGKVKLE